MMRTQLFFCGLAALLLPMVAGAESWTTVYRQPFGNDSGAFQQSWHYGWRWFHGEDGAEGTRLHGRIHYFSGPPVMEAVNAATPFGDSVVGGYWVIASTSLQFAFTEIDVSRDVHERISLAVDQLLTADDPWRFAVRLGDDWFVSEFTFANTEGWQTIELELAPDLLWIPLDFIPGNRIEIGTDSVSFENLKGNITAVGFLGKASVTASQRFDNFTVSVNSDSEAIDGVDAPLANVQLEEMQSRPVTREELREAVFRYFGPGPDEADAVDPQLVITRKEDETDHERWHLEYWVHEDDRATAYLLVPKPLPEPGEKLPLILAPHPTSLIGKDRAVGKYEQEPTSESEWREREARQYALHLVRRGYLVFAPDRAGFGERRLLDDPEASVTDQMNAYRAFLRERWPGWKLTSGKNVWDLRRALDFLTELDFVDENRIASIGHSLGSWDSLMLAAMDDRVKAVVANAGGMVFFDEKLWADHEALRNYLSQTSSQGMRKNVNLYLMLIAPRPMLYIWSLDDPYERGDPNALEGLRTIHSYYQTQYNGKNPWWRPPFSIFFHDRGHDFPPEARALSYSWLERWLAEE
ncbi:MAG TPA: alpha/beta fold hydrolase [Opitutales bacterium]|nr:alpha/beta fold hydrolase [Opitutales bacterium]